MNRSKFFTVLGFAWVVPLATIAALTRNPITAYFARQAYWLHSARGSRCYDAADYACSVSECGRMISLQPDRSDGYRMRARALLQLSRYRDATEDDTAALSRVVATERARGSSASDIRSAMADILHERGRAEAGAGRYAQAIQDFTQAIHLQPDISDAHLARMQVEYAAGETQAAAADADYMIRRHDESGEAYAIRSKIAAKSGRAGRSLLDMAEACRLEPGVADHWFDLGWAQFRAGRAADAVATYKEALIRDPDRASGYFRLCLADMAVGDPSAAMDAVNDGLPRATSADRAAARQDVREAYRHYPRAADQFDRVRGWFQ